MVTNALTDTRHINGYKAELKASLWFVEQGYEIYNPTFTQSRCDFIAVKGKEVIRCQVKAAYWMTNPKGRRYLQSTTRRGATGAEPYTAEDCDVIFIVADEGFWMFPVDIVQGQKTIVLLKGQKIRRKDKRMFDAASWRVF